MPRLKIDIPTAFHAQSQQKVRITDINYGGHLGNDKVLSLMHEARVDALNFFGYTELNVEEAGLIMSNSTIIYKNEAFSGDILTIKVAFEEVTPLGFDMIYHAMNQTEKEIFRAFTTMVFFDYEGRKIAKLPEDNFNLLYTKLMQRKY